MIFLGLVVFFSGGRPVSAEDIVNVDFPCPSGNCQQPTDIPSYLNTVYKFAVGISGLLALGMIVAGGVYYTVSAGNSGRQGEAKSMITSAIWGLVLLFASYLILNTVNPQITKLGLDLSGATPISSTSATSSVINSTICPDFSTMPTFPNNYQKLTTPDSNCGYRKIVTPSQLSVGTPSQYYEETVTIPPNSTIWQYPYFIESDGSSTAKCLIFAYKESDSSSTTFITLRDSISKCTMQTQSIGASANPTLAPTCNPSDPLPANTLTNEDAVQNLNGFGISVTSSGNCSDRCSSNCTSLWGIPTRVINTHLKYISDHCGSNCTVIVTGGTEVGHQSHGPGKPVVDLFFNPALAEYLKNSYKSNIDALCTTPQDQQYRINCNYDETVRHLHVQFGL